MTTRRAKEDEGGSQGGGRLSRSSSGGDTRGGAEAGGFYVYCVGAREELAHLFGEGLPEAIEPDAPLELVAGGELAAVASAVPLSDYGEEKLTARLADPEWIAVRAMRHERVVEHFARRAGIAPLRFGTIYLRREGVERMLAGRRDELRAAVSRLRGREEWGVNVYCDRAKLLERIVELSPRLRGLSERASTLPPGRAYLLRKQVDARRADEAREELARATEEIERRLGAASEAGVRLRVSSAEAAERRELAAKFAFLVERARFAEFRAAAEELAREREGAGLRLELAGPLPAYSFVAGS
ncbi:MAG: GvpL/GvpF family gas vesicle protein [Acidobacteria bacterium]|nr:GvpL/GvpF family gas vesicle protein [Acidobacteriota bacterium]